MKFKPGDQVSFVNEKGGGVILAVTKNGSYKVALEDGFDLTLPERELALVKPAPDNSIEPVQKPSDESKALSKARESKICTPDDEITFCVVPAEENRVLSGHVSLYLSNKTNCKASFVISYLKEHSHALIAYDTLDAGDEMELGSFSRQDLTDWENLHIQVLLFNVPDFKYYRPITRDLQILLPDIQLSSVGQGRFAFARQVSVFRFVQEESIDLNEFREKYAKEADLVKKVNKESIKNKQEYVGNDARHGIYRNTKVVDLHIGCLVNDISKVELQDILGIQLSRFRKEMDHALLNYFHSIVFIHGVGEGVLKKALIDELKFYPGITWRNGAFEKYGAGAIEVLLK